MGAEAASAAPGANCAGSGRRSGLRYEQCQRHGQQASVHSHADAGTATPLVRHRAEPAAPDRPADASKRPGRVAGRDPVGAGHYLTDQDGAVRDSRAEPIANSVVPSGWRKLRWTRPGSSTSASDQVSTPTSLMGRSSTWCSTLTPASRCVSAGKSGRYKLKPVITRSPW